MNAPHVEYSVSDQLVSAVQWWHREYGCPTPVSHLAQVAGLLIKETEKELDDLVAAKRLRWVRYKGCRDIEAVT